MRRPPLSQLRPSGLELWYVAFTTCTLILLGNGKLLLERVGLIGSVRLIGQQVTTKVVWGTNYLDTFRATAGVVNLIIWGGTGLIIYSLLQAIVRSLKLFEYEKDIDSKFYIHPPNFTHHAYWRQVVSDAILGFVLLAMLAAAALIYIVVAVPNGFAYIDRFILTPNPGSAFDLFIGFDTIFVGTLVLYFFLKLVIRHHRISNLDEE